MHAMNVRELKNNPSEALRMAKQGMVIEMNRDKPDAMPLHLSENKLSAPGVKLALATALFRDGSLATGRLADVALVDFIAHLSQLGIPVIAATAESVTKGIATLDA